MIDHIHLQGQLDGPIKHLEDSYRPGVTTFSKEYPDMDTGELYREDTLVLKFMKLNVRCRYFERYNSERDRLIKDYNIRGSVHRFHHGRSYCDLNYYDVPRALERFCKACHFNAQQPHKIRELEVGINIVTKNNPDDYLTMFKMYRGRGFHEMRVLGGDERPHGIERRMSDMYSIKIYNKTCYAKRIERKNLKYNILRMEVKFMNRAIKYYQLPDTVQALYDKAQFQKYVDKFIEIIDAIQKVDYSPNVSSLKGKDLRDYCFMHGDTRTYSEFLRKIQGNKKAVELEKKRYERVNAKLVGLPTISDELVKKSKAKIRKLMKS